MNHHLSESGLSSFFREGFFNRLFGGLKMTWAGVIVFAVCTGVYTGLMALLVPTNNSFHDIAVNDG